MNTFIRLAAYTAQEVLDPGDPAAGELSIQLGGASPALVVAYGINVALTLLGILFLGLMLYAGYTWMKARGNEEEVTKAKKTLESAVLGLGIVLASWGITQFIFYNLANITNAT